MTQKEFYKKSVCAGDTNGAAESDQCGCIGHGCGDAGKSE